jgi:ribose transport system substrate-binding protein
MHTTVASTRSRLRQALATGLGVTAILSVVTACSNGTSTSSGSSSGATTGKSVNVAFIGYASSNNYTQWAYKAMQQEASTLNANVSLIDGQLNPQAQLHAMQNVIESGRYKAIVVMANDPVSLLPALKQAGRAKIPVIVGDWTFGAAADQKKLQQLYPEATSTVGASYDEIAALAAKQIEAACAQKFGSTTAACNVGLMAGYTSVAFSIALVNEIKSDLAAQAPNISSTLTPQGEYTSAVSYGAAKNYLQSHGSVDVMFAAGDNMVPGIQRAVQGDGKVAGKDVLLVGLGGTKEAVAGIKGGTWFASTALYPYIGGKIELRYAVQAAQGQTVPATKSFYDMPGVSMSTVDKQTLAAHSDFKGDWSALGGP